MPESAESEGAQVQCYCPDCRRIVDAEATQCLECGAMFPALRDRQGSIPLALSRMVFVPIAVMAIASAVFGCASLFFPGGWVNLFPALFYLAVAAGLGYVARRLYAHSDRLWPEVGADEANLPHWQRLALEHLPESRRTILTAENHVDLWQCFKEAVAEVGQAPSRRTEVEAIFRYAWWRVTEADDADLRAEVEAYFYEDLPLYSDLEEQIPAFVSPAQFRRLESVFASRLTEEEFQGFRSHYSKSLEQNAE